ncbi:MAG: DUF2017 family protein, partial [Verrucomicrobiaceae bacterium]
MDIQRIDDQTVAIEDLDLFLCELLQQIPVSADPSDNESACSRLYSSPTQGAEPEFDEEWKEYVEPEMREHFESALDVVRGDMMDFPSTEADGHQALLVPVAHLESWIHALNQARLALGARYDVTEDDMDSL